MHFALEGKTRIQTQGGLDFAVPEAVSVSICRDLGIVILQFSAPILHSKLLQVRSSLGSVQKVYKRVNMDGYVRKTSWSQLAWGSIKTLVNPFAPISFSWLLHIYVLTYCLLSDPSAFFVIWRSRLGYFLLD